ASYCRWLELAGSKKRRASVRRSLELSSMLPRCYPDSATIVDAMMERRKPRDFRRNWPPRIESAWDGCLGWLSGWGTDSSWHRITGQLEEHPDFTEDLDRLQADSLVGFPSMGIKASRGRFAPTR